MIKKLILTSATLLITLPVLAQDAVPPDAPPVGEPTGIAIAAPVAPPDIRSLGDTREAAAATATPMTLEEIIIRTLQNNPQRVVVRAAVAAAQARVGTARSAGGLQVNASGNIGLDRSFGSGSSTFINTGGTGGTGTGGTGTGGTGTGGTGNGGNGTGGNGGTGTGGFNTNNSTFLGFSDSSSVGVSANLPVYNGGRVKASTRAAQAQARVQAAQALQTEQDLVFGAAVGYLDVLRSEQLLQVANSDLAVSRERQRVATVRFNAGAAARLEVFQANTILAEAQQRRIASSNAVGQAKATLNSLMARPPETPLRVEMRTEFDLKLPLPADLSQVTPALSEQLRAAAGGNRASLNATTAQQDVAQANLDVARAARKPSLGVSLGGFLRNPLNSLGNFALSLGLNVAQNLFDSGRSRSQIDEAQAFLTQARAANSVESLNVANRIEQSLLSLASAQGRQTTAQTSVAEAQAALAAAQLGFEAGARTNLEVSDAQSRLLTAQTNVVNARFDLAQAQAALASATGIFSGEAAAAYRQIMQTEMNNAATEEAKEVKTKKKKKFLGIF